jgi:hypothetical protein
MTVSTCVPTIYYVTVTAPPVSASTAADSGDASTFSTDDLAPDVVASTVLMTSSTAFVMTVGGDDDSPICNVNKRG